MKTKEVLFSVSVSVLSVGLFLLTLTLITDTAFASEGWESNLTIKIANVESRLSFGQKIDATNSVDGKYDVPSMSGQVLEATFMLTGKDLWRDIKSIRKEPKIWDLRIESPLIGELITISWNKNDFTKDMTITLIDPFERRVIDMKNPNEYIFRNNGIRYLRIEINYRSR